MDDRFIKVADFKKAKRKAWIREKYHKTKTFVGDNKEILIAAIPVAGALAGKMIKSISKHSSLKKEEHLKNEYCYDRSLGHYWELKRKLSNSEWIKIDKRKRNGEPLADILDDMKVLK